jgi:hypothetical protein
MFNNLRRRCYISPETLITFYQNARNDILETELYKNIVTSLIPNIELILHPLLSLVWQIAAFYPQSVLRFVSLSQWRDFVSLNSVTAFIDWNL